MAVVQTLRPPESDQIVLSCDRLEILVHILKA
jgi:hypothetical protein